MKRLLVMRHAKSSWNNPALADHDRPLNKRGKRDAPRMGQWLIEQDIQPDATVSSTATRAISTAELVGESFQDDHLTIPDRRLYHATTDDYCQVLSECLSDQLCVLVVSHNPGSEEWVYQLTGEFVTLPTAAIAVIDLDGPAQWSKFSHRARGRIANVWRPKEIF